MIDERPRCHICGCEGEFVMRWACDGGEMRRCHDCDFVFAWPLEQIDPVSVYSRAYDGDEARTDMADYAKRLRRREIYAQHEKIGLWSPAHHEALRWLEENVPAGSTVLEVGSGVGAFQRALQQRGYRPASIDPAKGAAEALQADGFQAWWGTVDTVPEGWLAEPPAAIVSFFVLHHIPDPVRFFTTLRERWHAPVIIGHNRAPTEETADYYNFPPRCWGWWSERAVQRAFERAGYASVDIAKQPKGVPQVLLPDRVHEPISSFLWRFPRLRVFVSHLAERLLHAGFKLLHPLPKVGRSVEGGMLVIASPARTPDEERYPSPVGALEAER